MKVPRSDRHGSRSYRDSSSKDLPATSVSQSSRRLPPMFLSNRHELLSSGLWQTLSSQGWSRHGTRMEMCWTVVKAAFSDQFTDYFNPEQSVTTDAESQTRGRRGGTLPLLACREELVTKYSGTA